MDFYARPGYNQGCDAFIPVHSAQNAPISHPGSQRGAFRLTSPAEKNLLLQAPTQHHGISVSYVDSRRNPRSPLMPVEVASQVVSSHQPLPPYKVQADSLAFASYSLLPASLDVRNLKSTLARMEDGNDDARATVPRPLSDQNRPLSDQTEDNDEQKL